MSVKKEFGDFQTPESLATRVVTLVASLYAPPNLVVEPTAGLGAFLKSSAEHWRDSSTSEGYEINQDYVEAARSNLSSLGVKIVHRDFFTEDWKSNLSKTEKPRVLVIGNPPWVTNSELGQLGSNNLPQKTNFQGLRGFDAKTGKSNFDIAVDACLFYVTGARTDDRVATVYTDLSISSDATKFGFIYGDLVSDIDSYQAHRNLDGVSSVYTWRSGVKHDAAKVVEFSRQDGQLINGYGELIEIEDDYVFPLLKSSDLGNGRVIIRKSVL